MRLRLLTILPLLALALAAPVGHAQIVTTCPTPCFDGPGILGGLNAAGGIAGLPDGDVRATTVNILLQVMSFLALAAVIAIIVAGIYLVVGFGSDDSKDRAKKIILYTLVGLVIVLFARVIVGIVTVYLADQVA